MFPVKLSSPRLGMREFEPGDVDPLLAIYGDPLVAEHMSFEPRDRDQVAGIVDRAMKAARRPERTEYSLAGVLPGGELVAHLRLAVDIGHPLQSSGQIGFAFRADQWGRGLGGHGIQLLLRLGFEHLGLHRIWGARSPVNERSARVMAQEGMVEEGTIRGHLKLAGGWRDSVVHSILRPEWDGHDEE
ncbi:MULTISPECIES: GNAT family protein [Nonomuraea]|uniref:GNAT family N-acetyltransferase n=1 Tax=Nonomuraea TaxID=83681 RepID=UPI001C5E0874|nr:GNAT family protein [Nonomuraea ceibae]